MKCPACKSDTLFPGFLEDLLRAHTCTTCGGNWVLIENYVAWKHQHPEFAFDASATFGVEDTSNALLCPMTGSVMQKYRVVHDSDHRLDYSSAVGGVWLDSGEWEWLKQENLAGSLNSVFTASWQKRLRDRQSEISFADLYREKFGEQSYRKAQEIRGWLEAHPHRSDLIAYLIADDPYSAER